MFIHVVFIFILNVRSRAESQMIAERYQTTLCFSATLRENLGCLFLSVIVESSSDGSTILRVLRNMEADIVQLLEGREDLFALRQQ